jgi:hypothetical protein
LRVVGDLDGDFRLAQRGALVIAIAIAIFLPATIGSAVLNRARRR